MFVHHSLVTKEVRFTSSCNHPFIKPSDFKSFLTFCYNSFNKMISAWWTHFKSLNIFCQAKNHMFFFYNIHQDKFTYPEVSMLKYVVGSLEAYLPIYIKLCENESTSNVLFIQILKKFDFFKYCFHTIFLWKILNITF